MVCALSYLRAFFVRCSTAAVGEHCVVSKFWIMAFVFFLIGPAARILSEEIQDKRHKHTHTLPLVIERVPAFIVLKESNQKTYPKDTNTHIIINTHTHTLTRSTVVDATPVNPRNNPTMV